MSFRIEEKIVLTTYELYGIRERLLGLGMSTLHPCRLVTSTYFDSRDHGMFVHSEEGVLPRKKIRIRNYGTNDSDFLLEEKISSVEGRFKKSRIISKTERLLFSRNGIVDSFYGNCSPKVTVSYYRNYFQLMGVRITFDTDIRYVRFGTAIEARDNYCVLEIKAVDGTPPDFLERIITEPRKRFSKFSRACIFAKVI